MYFSILTASQFSIIRTIQYNSFLKNFLSKSTILNIIRCYKTVSECSRGTILEAATCIPGTPDDVSDLIGIIYLNSFHDELSIEMTRLMAPCQTTHRMNAVENQHQEYSYLSILFHQLSRLCHA